MDPQFKSKTSWRSKLERPAERKVTPVPPGMAARLGEGSMLIPTPLDVDSVIRTVPSGKLIRAGDIRRRLAAQFDADITCGLCTGIFIRIAAEASREDRAAGRTDITPAWRVVTDEGRLLEKFPGGPEEQARLLAEEGHSVEPARGKKPPRVAGFQDNLLES